MARRVAAAQAGTADRRKGRRPPEPNLMSTSRSQLFASAVLALGGGLLAVMALAIVVARARRSGRPAGRRGEARRRRAPRGPVRGPAVHRHVRGGQPDRGGRPRHGSCLGGTGRPMDHRHCGDHRPARTPAADCRPTARSPPRRSRRRRTPRDSRSSASSSASMPGRPSRCAFPTSRARSSRPVLPTALPPAMPPDPAGKELVPCMPRPSSGARRPRRRLLGPCLGTRFDAAPAASARW